MMPTRFHALVLGPMALAGIVAWCAAAPAAAQQGREDAPEPYALAELLAAPFASGLIASPDGRAVAWLGYEAGRRNVWVAEAPAWRARRLTRYGADDGQPLSALTWTGDARALLYVRGGMPDANWDAHEPVNPTGDPRGGEVAIWLVPRVGGAPRRVGEGHTPVSSPAGDRVAFILRDTIRLAPLRTAGAPRIAFGARGRSARPVWSPDGRRLAFVSRRDGHAFVGVLEVARREVRWIAPSTGRDDFPHWSPDGTRLAFVRRPPLVSPTALPLPSRRGGDPPPFAIHVADVATGEAREVYRSPATPDGEPPDFAGEWSLLWAAGDTLLFASELTGWLGLYRLDAASGAAERLTPIGCEIADVRLARARDTVLFTSNCGDLDRWRVGRVAVAGGGVADVSPASRQAWAPAPVVDGRVAMLRSDALRPAAPAFADAEDGEGLSGWPQPPGFPLEQLVEPSTVHVVASDSTPVRLQLFLPPNHGPGRHPAVLFLHGGPRRQMLPAWHRLHYYHNAYAVNQFLASRGFVVVSVNFRGGTGYGRAFREAPGRGRLGAAELQDVLAAAAWLRARADVDTTRIGVWGGSWGGYLTALVLGRHSDWFAAGVDLHGVHDLAESGGFAGRAGVSDSVIARMRRHSPVAAVDTWRAPVLLIHGDDDRNVAFAQTADLAHRLRRRGVPVAELVLPDEGHGFLRHAGWVTALRATARFFVERLGTAVR